MEEADTCASVFDRLDALPQHLQERILLLAVRRSRLLIGRRV